MDPEVNCEPPEDVDNTDTNVDFSQVKTVATGWMLDFLFVSLCRSFKENNLDEFKDTISAIEAISQSPALKGNLHNEKVMICGFLARVMHGKQLDVRFDDDNKVMPLMSAAKLWTTLKDTVADEALFKNITVLLLVQSVAVCLEKGQKSSASSVLKWFEAHHEFPQNLKTKLSTVLSKSDSYHPFIMSFSFSRLLETVQSYLDAYLEKNPSDYLLKAAAKNVRSSKNPEPLKDSEGPLSADEPPAKDKQKSKNGSCMRTKRKLLSTRSPEVWMPESCKKVKVCLTKIPKSELCEMTSETVTDSSNNRRARKKWTAQLDKYLKDGVRRHGLGKWSRILQDYDFEGRTGVMLKDRWRILMKAHKVS
ncbi:telomeric repeat-binding factor 1 isoform X2 [Sphaeramia orbicularis]|uniref:Telomeric repeat-binding factor n=1 Tax=Sphaeramia orbicularis TaxID=375764 RepID=A0A673ALT8_9TELE|nr:telomeric repeat-binding factor 1 isoform X2 [Sphaeramia orbicularis]